MGAEADLETGFESVAVEAVLNGKIRDVEKKTKVESDDSSKPKQVAGGGNVSLNGVLIDDEITSTLAAASEKLQAAHMKEQEQKSGLSRCCGALYPKRLLMKLRDCYINTCMMAAEKGDFVDLVAGHPGMIYGDTVMSRNISQRQDRDHEEMLQASLSRQVSISLSRQQSQSGGMKRSASTGMGGLSRNASTGMSDLARQTSVGHRGTFGNSSSVRRTPDSNLYSAGRNTFLQQVPSAGTNGVQHNSAGVGNGGTKASIASPPTSQPTEPCKEAKR